MGGPGSLLLLPILLLGGAESRSHSLQYFLTAVSEPGPGVPEFTVAGYVDGQRFVEYDSEAQQMRPRAPWMQETEPEVWERENHVHKVRQTCFRGKVRSHMHLYNQSRGFHIFQYAYGCEIRADGSTGGFRRFGYDGGDFLIYDAARHRWEAPAREAEATQRRWNGDPVALQYYRHFLERECVEALHRYLQLGQGVLARRERPAVRVTGRDAPGGPTTLSCRAHGFYPRDITLSWLRHGGSSEQEPRRGGVLPNGDGTYHAWATVEVDPRERGLYRCCLEHESLAEPLIVVWEPPSESLLVPVVAGVILALGAVAVLVGLAWRRRLSGPQADLYLPAPASEHGSDSSITATHSLRYFRTAVSDPEPGLPAYVSVGYLDDNLFVECDSDSGLYKPRAQWIKDNVGADYWESGTKRGIAKQEWSRTSMRNIMKRYNQTGGFHTLQRRSSCEIREDGSIRGSRQLAYEGDDFLSFDMNTYTWVAAVKEAEITQRRWNEETADLQYRKQYTEKECTEWLTKYHQYGKEALQGREPAAVEVSGKATPDGLTSLSCRVYGFYPRDIAVTWMKNGEMREQETQRGDIRPSGDGTYQIQATLEIDPKEGGCYSCLVDHNSLTEPLSVFWEPKSNVIPIVAGVIGAVLAAVVGIITWRKIGSGKERAGYSPPGSYQGSSSSTENKLVGEGTSVPA